jgi:glycosyltransferase involved in cell wall biosynthesis
LGRFDAELRPVKLAFITPRYGADIATGAEHACWLLAAQVGQRHDVEVLTTCARDARTWKNAAPEGADRVRGVVVRRFAVSQTHDATAFARLGSRLVNQAPIREDELEWVRQLGPWSPGLIDYIKRQHRTYDGLIFFSLWHPPTVEGLGIAPDRSVLFPHAQLQPALRFGLWKDVLSMPRALGLLSEAERTLISEYVHAAAVSQEVVGVGVEAAHQQTYPRHQQDPADETVDDDELGAESAEEGGELGGSADGRGVPFRRRHRLYGSLALYGGRVEPDNGCEEMLEYFDAFTQAGHDATLVLMGVKMMRVPGDDGRIRLPGVLPDRERMTAYEAADVLIAPTPDDLLAHPVLESLAVGTPVLASTSSPAAVEHCVRSGGGLYYADRDEFVEALRLLTTDRRLSARLGEAGRVYVRQHFRWEAVLGRFDRLVTRLRAR